MEINGVSTERILELLTSWLDEDAEQAGAWREALTEAEREIVKFWDDTWCINLDALAERFAG